MHPNHAALRIEPFDGVGVRQPAHVFVPVVVDRIMTGELFANRLAVARFVRHEAGLAVHLANQNFANCLGVDALDMERADAPAALYQADNGVLMSGALADFATGLAADKGLVRLDLLSRPVSLPTTSSGTN